jgi:heme exporter protein C
MFGRGLRTLSFATVVMFCVALALVFFYAPLEADQGFVQKIFYIHVPLAIVALCGFVAGGLMGIQHLRTRDSRWDMRSYVAIHMSLIFAVGVLITGSIWARASWGHWWVWDEPTLVSFLIIFLLYATYQPLRFSIEDPERQSRYASVFAITAGAFVPLNFIAVRLSAGYVHPRVLGDTSNLPGPMALTFLVALVALALLYTTLCKYEMTSKHARAQLRTLRRRLSGDDTVARPIKGRSAAPRLSTGPVAAATGHATMTEARLSAPAGRSVVPGSGS